MESKDASENKLLTANEVAGILKCSVKTIDKLRLTMELPVRYKIFDGPKGLRWSREDVDAFIEKKEIIMRRVAEARDIPRRFIPVESAHKKTK